MTLPEPPYRASRRSAIAMAAGSGWPVDEPDTVRSLIDLLHSALSFGSVRGSEPRDASLPLGADEVLMSHCPGRSTGSAWTAAEGRVCPAARALVASLPMRVRCGWAALGWAGGGSDQKGEPGPEGGLAPPDELVVAAGELGKDERATVSMVAWLMITSGRLARVLLYNQLKTTDCATTRITNGMTGRCRLGSDMRRGRCHRPRSRRAAGPRAGRPSSAAGEGGRSRASRPPRTARRAPGWRRRWR